jgi:hypothetical protein
METGGGGGGDKSELHSRSNKEQIKFQMSPPTQFSAFHFPASYTKPDMIKYFCFFTIPRVSNFYISPHKEPVFWVEQEGAEKNIRT